MTRSTVSAEDIDRMVDDGKFKIWREEAGK